LKTILLFNHNTTLTSETHSKGVKQESK
jgi:hypothetical protein